MFSVASLDEGGRGTGVVVVKCRSCLGRRRAIIFNCEHHHKQQDLVSALADGLGIDIANTAHLELPGLQRGAGKAVVSVDPASLGEAGVMFLQG